MLQSLNCSDWLLNTALHSRRWRIRTFCFLTLRCLLHVIHVIWLKPFRLVTARNLTIAHHNCSSILFWSTEYYGYRLRFTWYFTAMLRFTLSHIIYTGEQLDHHNHSLLKLSYAFTIGISTSTCFPKQVCNSSQDFPLTITCLYTCLLEPIDIGAVTRCEF